MRGREGGGTGCLYLTQLHQGYSHQEKIEVEEYVTRCGGGGAYWAGKGVALEVGGVTPRPPPPSPLQSTPLPRQPRDVLLQRETLHDHQESDSERGRFG